MLLQVGNAGSIKTAIMDNPGLRHGMYIYNGVLVNRLIGNYYGINSNDINLLLAGF